MRMWGGERAGAHAPPRGGAGDRHAVVAVLFACFLIAHHVYLFDGLGSPLVAAVFLPVPAALLVWPRNRALFVLGALLHLPQFAWPMFSNHAFMSMVLAVGLLLIWGQIAARTQRLAVDPDAYFDAYAPLGRWLLIGMYVYGTLHKINADFLDPEISCAVAFWQRYGFPDFISDAPLVHAANMYGTLVVEASVIAMLLVPRLRWWGVLVGIAFHGFLGFVPPGAIRAYSLLAILLHMTFLPPGALAVARATAIGARLDRALAAWPIRAAAVLAAVGGYLAAPPALSWALILGAVLGFVALAGREPGTSAAPVFRLLRPTTVAAGVLAAAFMLNGLSPYLGFKTGQTIAMFSNLVTEGGRNNHLFMPTIALFDHQSRVATEIETDHPKLAEWAGEGYHLVEFQILDYLERRPDASAAFEVDGRTYRHTPETRLAGIAELPPRWLRNFMVFRPVDPSGPRECDPY